MERIPAIKAFSPGGSCAVIFEGGGAGYWVVRAPAFCPVRESPCDVRVLRAPGVTERTRSVFALVLVNVVVVNRLRVSEPGRCTVRFQDGAASFAYRMLPGECVCVPELVRSHPFSLRFALDDAGFPALKLDVGVLR